MRPESARSLAAVKGKPLAMAGEADRKSLADQRADELRALGRLVERAFELAGKSKQDVAFALGYGTNQAPVSRWTVGIERAPIERLLFEIGWFEAAWLQAIAEGSHNPAVHCTTTITIERRRA